MFRRNRSMTPPPFARNRKSLVSKVNRENITDEEFEKIIQEAADEFDIEVLYDKNYYEVTLRFSNSYDEDCNYDIESSKCTIEDFMLELENVVDYASDIDNYVDMYLGVKGAPGARGLVEAGEENYETLRSFYNAIAKRIGYAELSSVL